MMDAQAFTALAKQHMDMVLRLAFARLGNRADAEDITQNVFLALLQSDKAFESDAHLHHWLVRVTLNECRKHWRSPWSKREALSEDSRFLPTEAPESIGLYHAIMELDAVLRTVIVLHYCEGYTIAEIGKLLHIPSGTVGTRLKRAREKLKEYMEEAEDNER